MVESCGTENSASAQVANAFNQETAQCSLTATKVQTINVTHLSDYVIQDILDDNTLVICTNCDHIFDQPIPRCPICLCSWLFPASQHLKTLLDVTEIRIKNEKLKQKTTKNLNKNKKQNKKYTRKNLPSILPAIILGISNYVCDAQTFPIDCALFSESDELIFHTECDGYTNVHYDHVSHMHGSLVPISSLEYYMTYFLIHIFIGSVILSSLYPFYATLFKKQNLFLTFSRLACYYFQLYYLPLMLLPGSLLFFSIFYNWNRSHYILPYEFFYWYKKCGTKREQRKFDAEHKEWLAKRKRQRLIARIQSGNYTYSNFSPQGSEEPTSIPENISKNFSRPNRSTKRNKPRVVKRFTNKMSKDLSLFPPQGDETLSQLDAIKDLLQSRTSNTEQLDYFIHVCESLFITARYLQKAETLSDVMLAIANLTKHHLTNRTLCSINNINTIKKYADKLFKKEMELQGSTDELFFTLRNLLTDYTSVKKSPAFKKAYKLFSYFVALDVFEKAGIKLDTFGYNTLEKEVLQKKYHMGPDFIHSLLDTTLFFCERGAQCLKVGNLEPMFHTSSTHAEWFDAVTALKRQSKVLHNPALLDISEPEFLANLDSAIEKGTSIHKFASRLSDYDKRAVGEKLNDILMIKSEILCLKFANESRQTPFSVLLFGESGIGKSTIKDMLYYVFCNTRNLPNGDEYKYVRNPVSKYWDGFRSNMHSLILDDVAFMHPNKAPTGDESVLEFIQVINPTPFCPDQAALENKGKTPFRGQLVIATTNVQDLNAHYYFSHPSAVQRRFPYIITPTPLPEYTTNGMLDSNKVPPPTPEVYQDLWTFSVSKVYTVPIKSNEVKARIVDDPKLQNMNQKQFLRWYISAIKEHVLNQTKMTDSIAMMANIPSCLMCQMPQTLCDCDLQGLESLANVSSIATGCFAAISAFKIYKLKQMIPDYINVKRKYFVDLGNRVQEDIGVAKSLVALAGIVAVALTLWKLKKPLTQLQASEGITPEGKEERVNPWYKNDYTITNFDISRNTLSWKDFTPEQIMDHIKPNLMHLIQHYVKEDGKSYDAANNALALEGHTIITSIHALRFEEEILNFTIIRQNSCDGINKNISFTMNRDQIVLYPEHEIAVLTITQIPPFKRITGLFAKPSFNGTGKGHIISIKKSGEYVNNPFILAKKTCNVHMVLLSTKEKPFIHDVYTCQPNEDTYKGNCGAPYILTTPQGPVILGIHIAGIEGFGQALFLSQDIISKFTDNEQIVSGLPMLSSESAQREVGALAKKSIFRYIPQGSATLYGSFSGFKITPKTRVEKTPMNAFLQQRGYSTKYTKPVMSGWKPWRIAALDLVNPVVNVDGVILNNITEQFIHTIIDLLPQDEFSKLAVFDDFTALNGAAGVPFVDPMNMSTSAGLPWRKSKKFFLTAIAPVGGNLDPVEASPEIMDRMHKMIETYKSGERVHPNFCAHLKDEPVTFAKHDMGKTRVFSGAPFDWSLVVRKYYLSMIRCVQRNKFIFEAAPGTICQSSEWEDIFNYLTRYGPDRVVAGDYKAYDKRMPPAFVLSAFKIMIAICEHSNNFDDDDLRIMRGIAEDTAYPLTDFNGDLVEFYGSNPSGHPLTVIINSLVNSLYMRYVYYIENPNKEVVSFKGNVNLLTYGDDNIMNVSPTAPWFNHTSIQNNLASMGIVYTMADKVSESVPYIHINAASFLKRSWRFDDDAMAILCPLEHESIEKSLMVWTRSKTICWEEQAIAVMSSAAREYFFYGKPTYEKRVKLFKELIKELDFEAYIMYDKHGNGVTFPKYSDLVEQFEQAGR